MNQEESTSATTTTTSFSLKGFERVMAADPIRIAHVLHTSLSSETTNTTSLQELLDRAPKAWKWVTARHPRMRAQWTQGNDNWDQEITVSPSLSESALAASLVILQDNHDNTISWKDYVRTECHKTRPYTDTTETIFSMTLLPNSKENKLVLVLFSDHVFSDGFSGYVILRDFLHVLTNTAPSEQNDDEYFQDVPKSLPLQKPLFEQVMPDTFFGKLFYKVIGGLFMGFFRLMIPFVKTIFHKSPLLSPDQYCNQHFASGSAENLQTALEVCRSENTTLMGPICIAIALSMANATESIHEDTTHIKINAQVDMNLRNRVGMGQEHVGLYIAAANPSIFFKGLALDVPFWETARTIKESITQGGSEDAIRGQFAVLEHIPLDRFKAIASKVPHGILTDANISNLGRWPFGPTIGGQLDMDEIYLYHQIPRNGVMMGSVIFVTSIHSLQYGMTSIVDDASTMDAFFHTMVQIVESVGSIGPTTTLREVLQNVTPAAESPTK